MKSKQNTTGNPLLTQQNSSEASKLQRQYETALADFRAVWLPRTEKAEQLQHAIAALETERRAMIEELKAGMLAKTALDALRLRLQAARAQAARETIADAPRTRQRRASARGKAL